VEGAHDVLHLRLRDPAGHLGAEVAHLQQAAEVQPLRTAADEHRVVRLLGEELRLQAADLLGCAAGEVAERGIGGGEVGQWT
jgi:hypothetical protein